MEHREIINFRKVLHDSNSFCLKIAIYSVHVYLINSTKNCILNILRKLKLLGLNSNFGIADHYLTLQPTVLLDT